MEESLKIHEVQYQASYPNIEKCPQSSRPEYAFIGRSNVGKSSLINAICGRRELARVSKEPGKTQMLNFYLVENLWYLVDLPGYGYAKVSKKKRAAWDRMIRSYLAKREQLITAFVLLDINVKPQAIDLEFLNWMGENQVPFTICFTKTDKLKAHKVAEHVEAYKVALSERWAEMPFMIMTSSRKKKGLEDILLYIRDLNEQ